MEQPIPTEFTAFVHDIAIRALDNVGARAGELDTPLRGVARSWTRLSRADKKKFVSELIAAVQEPPEPKPGRAVKRFDPEEVKKTLPKKPKAAAKKKPKKASRASSSSRID